MIITINTNILNSPFKRNRFTHWVEEGGRERRKEEGKKGRRKGVKKRRKKYEVKLKIEVQKYTTANKMKM